MISGSFWKPSRGPTSRMRTSGPRRASPLTTSTRPPLTLSVCPVTYDASSEARKAIAAATSSGSPMRPIAVASIMPCLRRAPMSPSCSGAAFSSGVSIGPGATALQRTP